MARHFQVPVRRPEDIIPHLGKGEKQWRKGYSAYELATSWFGAGGFPDTVRAVLETSADYRDAEFIDAVFEREVELRTPGHPSQTDLMVLASVPSGLAVIAVEGNVDETFDAVVGNWNDTPGKDARLRSLCATLGLDVADVGPLCATSCSTVRPRPFTRPNAIAVRWLSCSSIPSAHATPGSTISWPSPGSWDSRSVQSTQLQGRYPWKVCN